MSNTFRIVDLFAGIGGLRNGVVNSINKHGDKAEIVFTSEIKKTAIATLKANFPEETIHGDITQINENDIPDHDILLAGFPCQAFSFAGTRKGFQDTTKGTLFFDTARIIKAKKPSYFILENVEGLITHDPDPADRKAPYGRTLTTILTTLQQIGYNVSWGLLDASQFGVPQARKRIFIVGSLSSQPKLPTPTQAQTPVSKILQKNIKETDPKVQAFSKLLTSQYSIEHLKGKAVRDKRGGPNNIHSWNIEYWGKTSKQERELLEKLALESRKKSWSIINKVHYTDGMPLSINNIKTFITMPKQQLKTMLDKLTKQGYLYKEPNNTYRIYSGKLSFPISRILHPDHPTPTLVATDADRLGVCDGKHIRRLTDTEIKRLFGFPDNYKTPTNITRRQTFDLYGNSVVSPVAEAVTTSLIYNKKQNKMI